MTNNDFKINALMIDITAAIIIEEEKVLIARRGPEEKLAGQWEFPGGKVESGESPEECLIREMYEEFGVSVIIGEFLAESVYHYDHGAIRLLAVRTFWKNGIFHPVVHDVIKWVSTDRLMEFDLLPADEPIAQKLAMGVLTM